MAIDYTTTDLISSIKIRCMMPSVQELFSDADICRIAGEVLRTKIVPEILKTNEEFFVTSADQAIVAGTSAYRIPARAAWGKLRDVTGVDTAGTEYELRRYEPSDVRDGGTPTTGEPSGYYLQHDQVVLLPAPTVTNGHSLRMKFERRPGRLCLVGTDAFKVTAYNTGTGVASGVVPSTWTTATIVDVIRADGLFAWTATDKALSAVSVGVSATLASVITDSITGQYVAEQGYSPIAQIPEDGHPWLAQETAVQLLAFHDDTAAKNAAVIAADMASEFLSTIKPRVMDSQRTINNRRSPFDYV